MPMTGRLTLVRSEIVRLRPLRRIGTGSDAGVGVDDKLRCRVTVVRSETWLRAEADPADEVEVVTSAGRESASRGASTALRRTVLPSVC